MLLPLNSTTPTHAPTHLLQVVAELISALSLSSPQAQQLLLEGAGGRGGEGRRGGRDREGEDRLFWAFQAWGELSLALIDPRNNPSHPPPTETIHGPSPTAHHYQQPPPALAWEVVRLMHRPPLSDGRSLSHPPTHSPTHPLPTTPPPPSLGRWFVSCIVLLLLLLLLLLQKVASSLFSYPSTHPPTHPPIP